MVSAVHLFLIQGDNNMDDASFEDLSVEDFINNILIPYYNDKTNDPEELIKIIHTKKKNFEKQLSYEQKDKFAELWKLAVHYCDIVTQDSFSDGYFKGMNWEKQLL